MNHFYTQILNHFPTKYIKFAFAYGSGVFEQLNNKSTSNMIDFVFVVDDGYKFHTENLQLNSSHYSFLKLFGPKAISVIQNDFGAACYYNTLVPIKVDDQDILIKYGVINERALIRDLFDWDYLYISGRLQKPVKIIKPKQTEPNSTKQVDKKTFDHAMQTNLQNALHTALLLMPEQFTLEELFVCITSLSYTGDFRMIVGENKQKCSNIVKPQMERFIDLYKPYLIKESFENTLSCNFDKETIEQNLDQSSIYHHLNLLPKNLIQTIINLKFKTTQYYDIEEYIYKLTIRSDYKDLVAQSISSIVRYSSLTQSFKSSLTAGFLKSLYYSTSKLKKMAK